MFQFWIGQAELFNYCESPPATLSDGNLFGWGLMM